MLTCWNHMPVDVATISLFRETTPILTFTFKETNKNKLVLRSPSFICLQLNLGVVSMKLMVGYLNRSMNR